MCMNARNDKHKKDAEVLRLLGWGQNIFRPYLVNAV